MSRRRRWSRGILVLVFTGVAATSIASLRGDPVGRLGPPQRLEDVGTGRLLIRTSDRNLYRAAPTLNTKVHIRVSGMVGRTRVEQVFYNPTGEWLEGVYVFPLPEQAAVDTMRMVVGERIIEGQIRERQEARRTYEKAKRQGKKASLLEQERPNIFTNVRGQSRSLGRDPNRARVSGRPTLRPGAFRASFPHGRRPSLHPGTDG